jgi:hypothetical protein
MTFPDFLLAVDISLVVLVVVGLFAAVIADAIINWE